MKRRTESRSYLLIHVTLTLLIWATGCEGRHTDKDSRHAQVHSCQVSERLNLNEPCNTETNCRFGGSCRQVTDIRSGRSTVRFIVPDNAPMLDMPFFETRPRRGHRRSTTFVEDKAILSQECVCRLDCPKHWPRTSLNPEVDFVCATDGRTYSSECEMREEACRCQTEIKIKWRGSCEQRLTQASERLTTFADDETLKMDLAPEVQSSGDGAGRCDTSCKFGAVCDPDSEDEPCKCNIDCDVGILSYVCGNDGRTYTSECHMRQAECRNQYTIRSLHMGPCTEDEKERRSNHQRYFSDIAGSGEQRTPEDPCQMLYCDADVSDPLCGTDDISYPNECVMRVASCVKEQNIEVKHRGYCVQDFEILATLPSLMDHTKEIRIDNEIHDDSDDPCIGIECQHGSVCIPHEEFEFICSCHELCNQEVPDVPTSESFSSFRYLPAFWLDIDSTESTTRSAQEYKQSKRSWPTTISTTTTATDGIDKETVILDYFKELKPAWMTQDIIPTRSERRRRRRRRDRNSHTRHARGDYVRIPRGRSRRSAGNLRPLINETMCGTDGKTYPNECKMRREACYLKRMIGIAHRGACPLQLRTEPPQVAPEIYFEDEETPIPTTPGLTEGEKNIEQRDEKVQIDEMTALGFGFSDVDNDQESSDKADEKRGRNDRGRVTKRRKRKRRRRRKGEKTNKQDVDSDSEIVQRDEKVDAELMDELNPVTPEMETREEIRNDYSTEGPKNDFMKDLVDNDHGDSDSPSGEPVAQNVKTREGTVGEQYADNLELSLRQANNKSRIKKKREKVNSNLRDQQVTGGQYEDLWKEDGAKNSSRNVKKLNSTALISQQGGHSVHPTHVNIVRDPPPHASYAALAWGIGVGQFAIIALVAAIWIYRRREATKKENDESHNSTGDDNSTEITNSK